MRSYVANELTKGPVVVQSLVEMIESALDVAFAESASNILFFYRIRTSQLRASAGPKKQEIMLSTSW
jgi:hypothetical protein